MAISKTITTKYGLVSNNAYHKVNKIIIANKKSLEFDLFIFASKNEVVPFENINFVCDYDINGENPIKQAYLHLKTLPEFADAVDC